MRRADRLFEIVQYLRRAGAPVTARELGEALEVVPRTIYRDIAVLQGSRVPIDGEAGIGYILRPGYDLPPLMFDQDEIEAIVLGARLVARRGDADLSKAAASVLAKVSTILPENLARQMGQTALYVPPSDRETKRPVPEAAKLRSAVRRSSKVTITYTDAVGAQTQRTIWPLGLSYFVEATLVAAWCELREGFRAFRVDRVQHCEILGEHFDGRGGQLLADCLKVLTAGDPLSDVADHSSKSGQTV
ncbi:YafY family protein [Sphingorhabdus sp.]|uniref:helix-turn-helix transcriptional regulator n=1 Tax=Sphingorhabdus sp. TaxID=1902408 RepID=UPI0032B7C571